MVEVFVSELPGGPPLSDVEPERLQRDGVRCGQSRFINKAGDEILIQHCLPPIRPSAWAGAVSWNDVARQTLMISAWDCDLRIGGLRLKRYNAAQGQMVHPSVWSAVSVDVVGIYRRQGVAGAMYQHARTFGYPVGPSHMVRGDGLTFWQHLDPTIQWSTANKFGVHPLAQDPRIVLPARDASSVALSVLAEEFRPNPTLAHALTGDCKRLLQDEMLRHLLDDVRDKAGLVLEDPRDLLRRIAFLVSRKQESEDAMSRSFARYRLGRPQREQLSLWHRYRLRPWRRRIDFVQKASELAWHIRRMVDEDDLRYGDCSFCGRHLEM